MKICKHKQKLQTHVIAFFCFKNAFGKSVSYSHNQMQNHLKPKPVLVTFCTSYALLIITNHKLVTVKQHDNLSIHMQQY